MNHFYESIQGWFSFGGIYSDAIESACDGDIFVEVGAWKGRSTAYMSVEIINSKKQIDFFVIDTWAGSKEHQQDYDISNLEIEFLSNLWSVIDYITPIKIDSVEAAKLFDDNTVKFVFIDASHEYEDVLNDLRAWYPKVQVGGVIAGHDYMPYWPGVVRAVDEFFGDRVIPMKEQRSWKVVKYE